MIDRAKTLVFVLSGEGGTPIGLSMFDSDLTDLLKMVTKVAQYKFR